MDAFEGFIQRRIEDKVSLTLHPGVVNNGVAAYYQQQAGLLPLVPLGEFPYEPFLGKLVGTQALAARWVVPPEARRRQWAEGSGQKGRARIWRLTAH